MAQLLSTASAASPLHATARSKRWPSIRAGLEGLGLGAEAIGRCRQLVLQGAGEAEVALFRWGCGKCRVRGQSLRAQMTCGGVKGQKKCNMLAEWRPPHVTRPPNSLPSLVISQAAGVPFSGRHCGTPAPRGPPAGLPGRDPGAAAAPGRLGAPYGAGGGGPPGAPSRRLLHWWVLRATFVASCYPSELSCHPSGSPPVTPPASPPLKQTCPCVMG